MALEIVQCEHFGCRTGIFRPIPWLRGMSLVLILAMVLATMLLDFDLGKELLLIQILSMPLAHAST